MAASKIYSFPNDISSGDFKSDFVWGSATSAYQIEGAALDHGRHPSIWDTFCLKNPGAILNGDNGNDATQSYYRTKEDVQMMKKMGLKAYRFSVSWSRILPGGKLSMGVNREGVAYYNDLINELISNGIDPYITLFHWDLPNTLEDEYLGFLDKRIISDFLDYAEFCFWEFGDRVKHWITLNEPYYYALGGYAMGSFAPGRGGPFDLLERALESGNNLGPAELRTKIRTFDNHGVGDPAIEPYIVAHNLLLTHANVVKLYRQKFQESQRGTIGITVNSVYHLPLDPNKQEDKDAASRATDFVFGWFMDPLYRGKYPDVMIKHVGDRLPKFTEEETKLLKGSYDFIGLNYYITMYATPAEQSDVVSALTDTRVHVQAEDINGNPIGPKGGVFWFYSYPPGFYNLIMYLKNTYGDPVIFITENGWPDAAYSDKLIEEARVDTERIEYYSSHLHAVRDAIKDGARVVGYFAWSLMDNFEWSVGYSVRFGLFYVDYKHGKFTRYPKNSVLWFMDFLKNPRKLIEDDTK